MATRKKKNIYISWTIGLKEAYILSLIHIFATLLSQHHQVTAVDIIPEKVDMINNRKSPIQDDYIEKYLAEKELNLTATLDAKACLLYTS